MIADYSVPADCQPAGTAETAKRPRYLRGRWAPEELETLAEQLDARGGAALDGFTDEELLATWTTALRQLLDPGSTVRQALEPALVTTCRLSSPALQAGLEAVLTGLLGAPARKIFERAGAVPRTRRGLVTTVLPGNVPALAAQVALPALALRRPLLLKSSSSEPLLAAALVHLLVATDPALGPALAAVTWRGGDRTIEDGVLGRSGSVVAFGDEPTMEDLEHRAPGFVPRGPELSLALVSDDTDLSGAARGLARDIALFEQRGCLSVHAVYTDGDAEGLARRLALELKTLAEEWPPPEANATAAAAIRQLRDEAQLRGLWVADLPLGDGTVIVDTDPDLRPSPGLRTVRIHPLEDLSLLEAALEPQRGRLQGAVLAGGTAQRLGSTLERLGVTRLAPPGELQYTDASWSGGRRHLVEELA